MQFLRVASVHLFLSFCLSLGAGRVRAEVVITFEDLAVPAQGFYNGNPGNLTAGQSVTSTWTSAGGSFANTFGIDQDYGFAYWAGFSYSAVPVSGSATFTNQYESKPGTGYNSATYAVAYYDAYSPVVPTITLPLPTTVSGFRIANTTYAYGSMTTADPYGFSIPLATGTGWFAATATGFRGDSITGTATFPLADLRGDSPPGILAGWAWFNLEGLGTVDRIEFSLDGSQYNSYGLTTPTYFAMDDLTIAAVPEPGAWACLLVGAGGLAAAARRRRCRRRNRDGTA